MQDQNRLPVALLAMRLTVFLVMLVWTLDKFIDPGHAAAVYERFYFLKGFGPAIMYTFGVIELLIVAGFVLGVARRFTYGTVLLFHAASTFASFEMYFNLAEGRLFFAAWPMLGACIALYLLRDSDTLWVVSKNPTPATVAR